MNQAVRNLLGAAKVALGAAVLLAALLAAWRPAGAGWAWIGFGLMAAVGVVGGAWLARFHGRPDGSFLVAMLSCMAARFVLAPVGMVFAARAGGLAPWVYVAGLAVGFVPLQLFEILFLQRRPQTAGQARVEG